MDENNNENEKKAVKKHMQEIGRKGGNARVEKYGREHMRELGRRGAEKRWKSGQAKNPSEPRKLP